MVQILNPGPSSGQLLGSSLGGGLSNLLQGLAEGKMQDHASKRKIAEQNSKQEGLMQSLQSLGLFGGSPQDQFSEEEINESSPEGDISEKIFQSPNISDEQIQAATILNPNLGRVLQSQKDSQSKREDALAKREFERVKPFLLRADERSEGLAQKDLALESMEEAIKEGNLGFFSKDNIADMTGLEFFRTPKGSQFISSGKEYFLGSLKRAGARPNQWIEQQIQKMLPKVGRSKEANLTVLESLRSEMKIEEEQQRLIDQLSERDMKQFGHIKGNLPGRVSKELKTFAKGEQRDLEQRLRTISGEGKNFIEMRDPAGQLRSVPKSDVNAASKAGYKVKR